MSMNRPPGVMANMLNCNGINVCPECSGDTFYGLVELQPGTQILRVMKCVACGRETAIPFGDEEPGRKFQA